MTSISRLRRKTTANSGPGNGQRSQNADGNYHRVTAATRAYPGGYQFQERLEQARQRIADSIPQGLQSANHTDGCTLLAKQKLQGKFSKSLLEDQEAETDQPSRRGRIIDILV